MNVELCINLNIEFSSCKIMKNLYGIKYSLDISCNNKYFVVNLYDFVDLKYDFFIENIIVKIVGSA